MRIIRCKFGLRRIVYYFSNVILAIFILLCSGCEKSAPLAPPTGKPSISLSTNTSDLRTIMPGESFITLISIKRGSRKLRGLSIFEDDKLLEPERVKIDNKQALGNPYFFTTDNNENINLRIEINSQRANKDFEYRFVVSDFGGESAEVKRTISVKSIPPKLKFNGPTITLSTVGQPTRFKLNGIKGSGLLKSLEVWQNNILVEPRRLSFGTINPTSNPFLLNVSDASAFDKDLIITSPNNPVNLTYTFILKDDLDAVGIDSAKVLVGNPVTELVSKNLYNAARGGAFGGIILKDGTSVSSQSVLADIIDTGIDSLANNPSVNWKRQFRAGNNVEIRRIIVGINGIPQNFSYINIFTQEQIVDLFSKGVAFTAKDKEDRPISDPVQIGQIFVVKKGNDFYLIEIVGVVQTPSDNEDYYRLNYKF